MTVPLTNYPIESPAPDLAGMTLEEIERFIAGLGKERYRAVQLMKWVHQALAGSFDDMTNLSKALRAELARCASICRPEVVGTSSSEDGTKKFLLELHDRENIETVLIPGDDHDTLCVSTQVGCAMGCRICRTAKMGLKRNLSAAEIVAQLLTVRRQVPGSRITNVVFMGMGEPLANLEQTVRAIGIMTHPNGPQISWRRLTVSTSGLVPRIRELGHVARVKLAVSLERGHRRTTRRDHACQPQISPVRATPMPEGIPSVPWPSDYD